MPVTFNHTIIAARDRAESARFFRELFELPEAPSWGPFTNVLLDQGVLLQFAEPRWRSRCSTTRSWWTTSCSTAPTAGSATAASTTGPTRS